MRFRLAASTLLTASRITFGLLANKTKLGLFPESELPPIAAVAKLGGKVVFGRESALKGEIGEVFLLAMVLVYN